MGMLGSYKGARSEDANMVGSEECKFVSAIAALADTSNLKRNEV